MSRSQRLALFPVKAPGSLLVLVAALCILPLPLAGQRTLGLQCSIDPSHRIPCSGDAECSRLWCSHLSSVHHVSCDDGGTSRMSYPVKFGPKAPYLMAVLLGSMGATVGGALGGMRTDEEKQRDKDLGELPPALGWGLGGAGAGFSLAATFRLIDGETTPLELGGLGASVGAALGKASDKRTDEQKKEDAAQGRMSPALQGATVGLSAGIATGFALEVISKYDRLRGVSSWLGSHLHTGVDPLGRGTRIGLRW